MPATNLWFSLLVIIISRAHRIYFDTKKSPQIFNTQQILVLLLFVMIPRRFWLQVIYSLLDCFKYELSFIFHLFTQVRSHGTKNKSLFSLFFSVSLFFLSENIWIEQHVWVQYEIYRDDGFCRKNSHNKIKTIAQQ